MAGKPTFSLVLPSRALLPASAVLGALVVAYGALQVYAGAHLPRNAVVGATHVGGLTRAAASEVLTATYVHTPNHRFHVHVADKTFALPAVERAVRVDIAATIDGIERRRWNPFALIDLLRGQPMEPVVTIDESALDPAVRAMTRTTAIPAVNAGIDLGGTEPQVVPARAGLALDPSTARRRIVDAALAGSDDVTLERREQSAVISTLVAQEALRKIALPAIAESVTVMVAVEDGTQRVSTIRPETLRAALSFVAEGALLEPRLDGRILRQDLDPSVLDVQKFAKRAKFRVSGESITVVPSIDGYGISADSIARDVGQVIRLRGAARTVTVKMGPITPAFTTDDAKALGITELVSSYTQAFPAAAYRTINIGTAARYINGTILQPGETFSMNDTVKERTPENGYTKGWIIGPDGVFRMEQGGAVSTITTAMFNAAWFAGLKLVEHRAHSIYISRYEPGREATVSWGSFDMKFRNNLDHALLITTRLRSTSISVYFWGTKRWPAIGSEFGPWTNQVPYREIRSTDPECHEQDGEPGFRITVYRTFLDDAGNETRREPYVTTYRPSPHVICVADEQPKPKPRPKPKPTPTTPDTSTV